MFTLEFFLDRIMIPVELAADLLCIDSRIRSTGSGLHELAAEYYILARTQISTYSSRLEKIAQEIGVPAYMIFFLFYAYCAPALFEDYKSRGIPEDVFWENMAALRIMLLDCMNPGGSPGALTGVWTSGFFDMTRFTLGRLQFEIFPFRGHSFEHGGHRICRGENALAIHIPPRGTRGPFTRETRMDAYRRAYEFFGNQLPGSAILFTCYSWLLYPVHEEFLPADSNILDFMRDFTIIYSNEREEFSEGWRIFGDKAGLPPAILPRETSLQRAYADWLSAGKKTGAGYGVFFFDGKKIL